jgi:hypothetical protein
MKSGFGGAEVAGSNPAETVGFLKGDKNPQHAFLRKGSKIIGPMSQIAACKRTLGAYPRHHLAAISLAARGLLRVVDARGTWRLE